jgi:hypothetical protein
MVTLREGSLVRWRPGGEEEICGVAQEREGVYTLSKCILFNKSILSKKRPARGPAGIAPRRL